MPRNILIIQGHPDPAGGHYDHALADAYAEGAEGAGYEVRRIAVATLEFPLLRSAEDWKTGTPPAAIQEAQDAIAWADHLVIIYPLWLGTMPALLKGFLEQVMRPGFALQEMSGKGWPKKGLKDKSARIVVTMGMPAFVYRLYFRAHSLKSFERNILKFCGISPIRESLIGLVQGSAKHREKWLEKMRRLGVRGR